MGERQERKYAEHDTKPNVVVSRMYIKQLLTKMGALKINLNNVMNNDLSNTQNLTNSLRNRIVGWYENFS